ncbi:MAG: carbohydrate-binding protein [Ruminococcaceae bacterium]|nr:carbohydrate-binding protein [Oscillospiraceae bacterium]
MKQIFNPFTPINEYIPDAEPHVFGDRVYIYGSHDKEGGEFFCMLDYVTYSAPVDNLRDWRYEGVIYKASQDPLYPEYRYMYAPDVVKGNDGKYYLYYSLGDTHGASFVMSVAVAASPVGPFEYLGVVKNPDGTPLRDYVIFDPGLLNDNGHIYLYYGFWFNFDENPKYTKEESIKKQMESFRKTREEIESTPGGVQGPVCVELEDDMMTIKQKPKRIFPSVYAGTSFADHQFFEASSMRKIGNKYYFIYSAFTNQELAYATSDYPDRDFKYGGVLVSNGDVYYKGRLPKDRLARTGNTHGSIENINGDWYVFYHRQTRKNEFSRQACAEKIEILEDGRIPQVEMTSCGLNGTPLIAKGEYSAFISCNLTDGNLPHGSFDYECPHLTSKGEDYYATEVHTGTMMGFKYFDFDGVNKIGINYRSGERKPSGTVYIKTDLDGAPIGKIEISDIAEWTWVDTEVEAENGTYPVYFIYQGEGMIDIRDIRFN